MVAFKYALAICRVSGNLCDIKSHRDLLNEVISVIVPKL